MRGESLRQTTLEMGLLLKKSVCSYDSIFFLYDFKLNAIGKSGININSRADSADNVLIYLIH